jgi:hypothetical protein
MEETPCLPCHLRTLPSMPEDRRDASTSEEENINNYVKKLFKES